MNYLIGLGNPGDEYKDTRHNAGRIVLELLAKNNSFSEWKNNGSTKTLVAEGSIENVPVTFLAPNNFMNNSGENVAKYIKPDSENADFENMIVIYDDIDLPFGSIKISHEKNSGGHNGIESIINSLGSKAFTRIRIGVAPVTPEGEMKKPKGHDIVTDYLMNNFKLNELKKLEELIPHIEKAIVSILTEGYLKAASMHTLK